MLHIDTRRIDAGDTKRITLRPERAGETELSAPAHLRLIVREYRRDPVTYSLHPVGPELPITESDGAYYADHTFEASGRAQIDAEMIDATGQIGRATCREREEHACKHRACI